MSGACRKNSIAGRARRADHVDISNWQSRLRAVMLDTVTEDDVRDILVAVMARAKSGDLQAARMILGYAVGNPPRDERADIAIPPSRPELDAIAYAQANVSASRHEPGNPGYNEDHERGPPASALTPEQQYLVEANLPLAKHLAQHHLPAARLHWDDRLSAATHGLIAAAISYDESRGPFGSYAGRCIRRHINEAVWNNRPVRLPKHLARHVGSDGFRSGAPCVPGGRKLRGGTAAAANRAFHTVSLGFDIQANMPSPAEALEASEDTELRSVLAATIVELARQELDHRSYFVLAARLGLDGRLPSTQREIADTIGVTEARVRQIETKSIETLRRIAGSKGIKEEDCGEG